MRIARIELDGIGPFVGATFDIPEPTDPTRGETVFFEGPNGSGKTTLAQAIAWSLFLLPGRGPLSSSLLPPEHPLKQFPRRFHGDAGQIQVDLTDGQTTVETQISPKDLHPSMRQLAGDPGLIARNLQNFCALREGAQPVPLQWAAFGFTGHHETPRLQVRGPGPLPGRGFLARALLFGHEESLLDPNRPEETGAPLGQFLSNLDYDRARAVAYQQDPTRAAEHEQLARLARNKTEILQRLQDAFTQLLDRRVEFRFRLEDPSPHILFDGQEVPLDLLGEGLRSTVSWLSELLLMLELIPWADRSVTSFEQPFWLILDEVEQSLHPQLQLRLFPTLRKLFPRCNIYATTHSPFVVASVADGVVFSLDPAPSDRQVRGPQKARRLEAGQTLERILDEVFETPFTFLDPQTRAELAEHERLIKSLQRGAAIDWERLRTLRQSLLGRTDEVRTVVALRESRVRALIAQHLGGAGA